MTDDPDLKVLPQLTQAFQIATDAIGNLGQSFNALTEPVLALAEALEEISMDCAYCTDYIREEDATKSWRRPGAAEDEIFHFDCLEIALDDPEFVADSETLC